MSQGAELYCFHPVNLPERGGDPHDLLFSDVAPYQGQGQSVVIAALQSDQEAADLQRPIERKNLAVRIKDFSLNPDSF